MSKQAEFYRAEAARMREQGKTAPTLGMRQMFEALAFEYEKLADREAKIVR